jgi:2-hydroxychromene-2-carboxylate isomerase
MAAPIDFYFDFSSPYGYLAAMRIDALAAKYGREVAWHPILLGVIFKQTGGAPLTQIPLKGEYSRRDFARTARFLGIGDFRMPEKFPIAGQVPARAMLWARREGEARSKALAKALYRAYFAEGIDVSEVENTLAVAAKNGFDAERLRAALGDPAVKQALVEENAAAMQRGVFGSPFVIVDGEPFWGTDRFDQIERWLATGPF